jgi:hypothetical protein
MAKAGLSPAQQKLVKTRDARKIADAIAAEQTPGGPPVVVCGIVETMIRWWGKD